MKLHELIRKKREERNMTIDKVVEELEKMGIDTTKSSLSRIENGERQKIDSALLVGLANLFDFNFFKEIGYKESGIDRSKTIKRFIEIPVYGKASAGNGYINLTDIQRYEKISVLSDDEYSNDLFLVEVAGESMYPTLFDGDLVIVNPNFNENSLNNKICVITYDGVTFIKRIQITEKYIVLSSDNPDRIKYQNIIIPKSEYTDIVCHGIVIERRTRFIR